MTNKRILIGLVIFLSSLVASGHAVTPEVRLPAWHKIDVKIHSWNPQGNVLLLAVTIDTISVPLRDISVNVLWPKEFRARSDEQKISVLEKGKNWRTLHTVQCPSTFDGWIEVAVAARPDPIAMKGAIAGIATLTPLVKEALFAEVKEFTKPIAIGRSIPLFLDNNIVALSPAQLLFSSVWPLNENRFLILWSTPGIFTNAAIESTFNLFREAVMETNPEKALSSLNLILKQTIEMREPIEFKLIDESTIAVPIVYFREAITVDKIIVANLKTPEKAIAKLLAFLKGKRPGQIDAFVWANIGTLQYISKSFAESSESYRRALQCIPTWPMINKWLEESRRQK